jgi:hypothetical protein
LFKEWIPFCNESALIEKLGHAELLMYVCVSPLLLSRDTCLHAYGADCLFEHDKIILIGRSVDHEEEEREENTGRDDDDEVNDDGVDGGGKILPDAQLGGSVSSHPGASADIFSYKTTKKTSENGTEIEVDSKSRVLRVVSKTGGEHTCPWKQETWTHKRMQVTGFTAIFTPTGPTSADTVIMACVDPHLPLHPAIINFVVKKMAGLALYLFQKRVAEVARVSDCSTAIKMRQNKEFYRDGLALSESARLCKIKELEA